MTITYHDEIAGMRVKIYADYTHATREPSEASVREVLFMGGNIKPWLWTNRPVELSRLRSECLSRCEETLDEMRQDRVNCRMRQMRESA